MSCAILLLCAGASSRWGRPKALLRWDEGETLGGRLARASLLADVGPVVRVLGAHAAQITATPAPAGLIDTLNGAWAEGMGGSIACGLRRALAERPDLDAAIVLPCDLPLVTTALLVSISDLLAGEPSRLVRCDYENGAHGPPAGFGRAHFPELRTLRGDEGGRTLFARHPESMVTVPFADGRWDLDCVDDLMRFRAEPRAGLATSFSP
jgi:molybdenum cofactor cytidylyltransferase